MNIERRGFLAASAASCASISCASILALPYFKLDSRTANDVIVGKGEYQFRVNHDWAKLPDKYSWQTTHNVAVDRDQNLYVIHEGRFEQKDHPSIFVFDPRGKFIRAFGNQFQGGGHGIEVRQEGSDQFLYIAAYQQRKTIAKLDLKGETVWQRHAPMESGIYAPGEDQLREIKWGRDRFNPTNFAFMNNGDFLLADGYGSYYIHRYDRNGNWKSCWGGPGDAKEKFNTPHGIWMDDRGEQPVIIVCDRANHQLKYFHKPEKCSMVLDFCSLPANIDIREDVTLVAELHGRLTLIGRDNKVVARLGDDSKRIKSDSQFAIRRDSSQWKEGKFVHPHDACFDAEGNIFVAEWVHAGRITKLERV